MDSIITVNGLKYRYPHTKELALDDISFCVKQGEIVGIVGANGAGKSTLTQALIGLVPQFYKGAYGGKVAVKGIQTDITPISELCKTVGLVFQNPFNQLSGAKDTVFEEIAFGLQNLGVARDEIMRRVEEAMELLDIKQFRERNPFDLSGGQMQRVAIASVLVMQPDILVLDEPTSQLDPAGTEDVFRAVSQLVRAGKTIVIVEQKMEKIASYCNRLLLLHKGKQIAYDTPEAIFSRNDLEELGVQAPIYTRIARALDMKNEKEEYPVTQEEFLEYKKNISEGDFSKMQKVYPIENSEDIFRIDDLSFSYTENVDILNHFHLTLQNGTTAIIGQNGAGKTTLVKLLKGLLQPVYGNIFYKGQDNSKMTVAMLAGEIGYIFQNPDDQIFKSKVIDEVMFGPLNIGMKKDEALTKAKEALEMVGLTAFEQTNPYDLELSQRKMVAIASVIAMDTSVIIFDEPTIAQDYQGKECIKKIIAKLTEKGKMVIAILHDMDFVAECFERVIIMEHGKILADGTCTEVFADQLILEKAKVEKPHVAQLCDILGFGKMAYTVEEFVRGY